MKLLANFLASADYAVFQDDLFDRLRACCGAIVSASRATESFVWRNESLVERYQKDGNPVQFLCFLGVCNWPEPAMNRSCNSTVSEELHHSQLT